MDDITPATRRMTYAELGAARGISAKSAERLTQRRRWVRQIGNDGMAWVLVPLGEENVVPRHRGPSSGNDDGRRLGPSSAPDIGDVVRTAIGDVVAPLSAQLDIANQRAEDERARGDRAEQRLDEEHARADRAEARATSLRAELADAQGAERKTVELLQYVTAEASEQRKRADDALTAERIAREEAAGLRAELEARRVWGLRRRLRWAPGPRR